MSAELVLQERPASSLPFSELLAQAQRLVGAGKASAAASLYEQWLAESDAPQRYIACFNLGTVLVSLRRLAEAEKAYRQALELKPGFIQPQVNLGHVYEDQGRTDEALAAWERVLNDIPQNGQEALQLRLHVMNNIGRVHERARRYAEAETWLSESLRIKANQPDVLQTFITVRQRQCQWPVYHPVGEVTMSQLLLSTGPLAMLGATDDPALNLLAVTRHVNERVNKAAARPLYADGQKREGRIRIGYLSGDLNLHAVGMLTAELFGLHDRSRFEVFGFCWSKEDGSDVRQRIVAGMDHLVRIGGMDDVSAARKIAELGIDVLVDLQGLTQGARPNILAQQPAPIQVSYLGFPGTSALPGVEYIIADDFVMPPELLPYMTERPIYVPGCYQVSDRHRTAGTTPQRSAYGLPPDAFVFCSFNQNLKFTEEVFAAWLRILGQVPNSVLWLLADTQVGENNMVRAAQLQGVQSERLVFAPRVKHAEYLARLQLADLFLDSFPYNAGTTANDALWMGTPVLTLSGRSYVSRMAGSQLRAVGLPELVTTSLADYERLAVELGQDRVRAREIKRHLLEQGRRSRLFDVPGFVRDLELELERLARAARDKP